MNKKKVQEAKVRIYEKMKPFIDENKCIDISAFRKAYPSMYSILPHYFGSVDKALLELGLVKVNITVQKATPKGLSLRDKLAFDMLNQLRLVEKDSLQSIADRYGVTKPLVAQLHKALINTAEKLSKLELAEAELETELEMETLNG